MERSVEQYSLHEPIDAAQGGTAAAAPGKIHGNPLSEEPHPALVATVRRFGVAGLVVGALGTALLRWWKTLAG